MRTAAVEATASNAGVPARRKASSISAVIKATEPARVRTRLRVKARTSVKRVATVAVANAAVSEPTMAKVAVTQITMMEPVMPELSAVRHELVVVEGCPAAMPVISPMAPAPAKSAKISESKSNTKRQSDAAPKNSRHRIPARIGHDRSAIHKPRIVGRHVNRFRISRLNNDCVSLRCYVLLFIAAQMSGVLSVSAHLLNSIGHVLRVVGVGLAQRRTPRQILVHVLEHGRKLRQRLYARIPILFVYFFGQVFAFEVRMPLHPPIRLNDLRWIRRSRKNLSNERIRIQRNRRHQLLQLFRRRFAGRSRRLFVGLVLRTVGFRRRRKLHQQTAEQYSQNLFRQFHHGNSPVLTTTFCIPESRVPRSLRDRSHCGQPSPPACGSVSPHAGEWL